MTFHSELTPSTPQLVRADDRRLRQVLINLLGNAVKFTPAGEVRLAVRSARLDGELWRLTFEVADTGIGIGSDDLTRIFDPFYQVAGRNSEGIGLGLAITRRLVEAMGGELAVASELGRGTTFTLTLGDAGAGAHDGAGACRAQRGGLPRPAAQRARRRRQRGQSRRARRAG